MQKQEWMISERSWIPRGLSEERKEAMHANRFRALRVGEREFRIGNGASMAIGLRRPPASCGWPSRICVSIKTLDEMVSRLRA